MSGKIPSQLIPQNSGKFHSGRFRSNQAVSGSPEPARLPPVEPAREHFFFLPSRWYQGTPEYQE